METLKCLYCEQLREYVPEYSPRAATRAVSSRAPRCDLHWRYRCASCGDHHHFRAVAFCSERNHYFCRMCAHEVSHRSEQLGPWLDHELLRSPWSGNWEATLDKRELDGEHAEIIVPDALDPATNIVPKQAGPVQRWQETPLAPTDSIAAWDANAQAWNNAIEQDGDTQRRYVTDPVLHSRLGDVSGLDVVDIGAGNGYLAVKLARAGARITAIESSAQLFRLATASCRHEPHAAVHQASATDLSDFPDGAFDVAVSNYVLMSVANYDLAIAETRRVLRDRGRFLVTIAHPCFSCGPRQWTRDAPDAPRIDRNARFEVDHYLRRGLYTLDMGANLQPVPAYHRTLSDYWRAFTEHGFQVDAFDEPSIAADAEAHLSPDARSRAKRVPAACVFTLTKT